MIEIIDPRDNKKYTIKDLKIVYYDLPDKKGKMKRVKCIEYTVVGKHSEWKFWMKYKNLKAYNPNIFKE